MLFCSSLPVLLWAWPAVVTMNPDYDNVTPPQVVVVSNTLTGVITDISGKPLSRAIVTLGSVTASSNESGVYLFDEVKAGTYAIKVEATGKLKKEGEITVTDSGKSQNLVWGTRFATGQKVEVTVSSTDESEFSNILLIFYSMYNLMKKGVFALLVASLSWGVASCSDDDPDYDNVTPPEVETAPNTLSGVITAISGDVIAGATVTLGGTASVTAQSDAQGIYRFTDVEPGTYTLKAEATGKLAKEGTLTVEDLNRSQALVWNAALASDVKEEVTVSTTETSSGQVATETLKDNVNAEVTVDVVVPAGAVEAEEGEEVSIIVSPIYEANDAAIAARGILARAEESTMLVGSALACSKTDARLQSPVELGFNVDAELASSVEARQYVNGEWVAVESRTENGKVIVEADEFTSYGLFLGVDFSSSDSTEPISFSQSTWDNLYGSGDMTVGEASYTYRIGTEIQSSGTSMITALLIEKLAQRFGATVSTATGSYPLNVTLPVGTMLSISGVQATSNVTASGMGRSVSGTRYGTVTVTVTTANRQHNGGTN